MIITEPRYYGEFLLDGQPRMFNIEATSEEDVWEKLMLLYPGSTVSVKSATSTGEQP